MSSFQVVGIVYRCVLISWGRNSLEVPLYSEVSSFQGVDIEGFHCVVKIPSDNVLLQYLTRIVESLIKDQPSGTNINWTASLQGILDLILGFTVF